MPRIKRRRMLALMSAGAAVAVGPIAAGWQSLLGDAAGTRAQRGPSHEQGTATPEPHPITGELPKGTAEERGLIGTVDEVLAPSIFIGSSKRFSGVTVDVSKADPVYPEGHVPRVGDDFHSRGRWLGDVGRSTFEVDLVDYNIRRVRGALSTSGITDPEADYRSRDIRTNESWEIVVRPENIDYLWVHSTVPEPSEASLTFPDGTGADIIGYEVRPGVIIATFIEAHP